MLQTWSQSRILVILIAVAVLLRLGVALVLGDNANPVSGAADQYSYDILAQRLLEGKGYSFPTQWYPFTAPDEQTAHWSFLYPLFLAAVYLVFGHHPLAARLIQVLISGLSIWLIYRIANRLFGSGTPSPAGRGGGSWWVGLAAAAATAFYAYLIFFNAALMTQSFYILALLWSIDIALDLASTASAPTTNLQFPISKYVLLGLALGLGTLTRQTLLLFAPILFAWLVWVQWRNAIGPSPAVPSSPSSSLITRPAPTSGVHPSSFRRPLPTRFLSTAFRLLPTILVIAAFILPFTIRNYLVFHDFLLLNSNSGFWFYSSNHPNQGTNFDPNYVAPIPNNLVGLAEPAMDRALLREGLGFIISDPVRFILLSINRMKDYFWLVPSEQSSLISNISRLFSFTLYLPFMLYGLYLSRKNWRLCLPLYLYAAFDTGLCLFSWAAPRYRLPTDSLMMVFVGLAVVDLGERVGISKWLATHLDIRNLKLET